MADYLKRHLQNRSDNNLLSAEGIDVTVHVSDDFGGDFSVQYVPGGGYALQARDERTMTWLLYQFIKHAGKLDPGITTDDLPPCQFPLQDTTVTFPFEYRDIYMPTNQNPDMTYLLGLHNLEMDWGIWGHNISRVLGSNGNTSFGYLNMDQELFARTNGLVHQGQFCFSSDKLLYLTEQYILDQYGDGEKFPYRMTISPNDNDYVCTCRRCEDAGNRPGNATPAVVAFVEKLSARFPNHTFFIPGYSTTRTIPDHRLPDNVGVFLSAMDYPRVWADGTGDESREFLRSLDAWKAVTDNIYIWDYICNFDDYLSPYPILRVMQQRFRLYREQGVKGVFLNGSGYYYSFQQQMYTFVLSALLLNPDADIPTLVREYYKDAMPHVGDFFSGVILSMEDHFCSLGKELPMYGGMKEAMNTYLHEKEFREFYSVFLRAKDMEMTHRERVLYEKTRQFVSFSFMEMCRLRGLGSGGFAELIGNEWVVKPEVWSALEDLKIMTPEEDLWLLTDIEESAMDHMDRVNEAGVYVADYENEVELWLTSQYWNRDHLLRQPLKVHSGNDVRSETALTDGVIGISQNYHWGWQVYPQKNLVVEIPPEAVSGKSGTVYVSFLNSERHRIAPPASIEIWADNRNVGLMRREGLIEYLDEGEKVIYQALVSFGRPQHVELRFIPSHTRNLAMDEIFFK